MMRLLLISCLLLLGACASQAPLPEKIPALALPMQLHVQRLADGQSQDWLLVIQREGQALRWSMMDPLGIPWPGKNCSMGSGRQTACCRPTPRRARYLPRCCLP